MRILFIHGRAQGDKDAGALQHIWEGALKVGLQRAGKSLPAGTEIDFPYYGDALDTFAEAADLPMSDDVLSKGADANPELDAFMKSALIEMYEKSDLTEAEVDAQLPADQPVEKGIGSLAFIQAIARAIDTHLPGLSEKGIEIVLRDVFLYVKVPFVQDAIDKIVRDVLTDEPTVVVGHSLGSVVGYNIIRQEGARRHFCKHITLGSPLGIGAVAAGLGVPENSARNGWFNAYDEGDIVALNPLEKPFFGTNPKITNDNSIKNRTSNKHGIIGYLEDATIAGAIADAAAEHG